MDLLTVGKKKCNDLVNKFDIKKHVIDFVNMQIIKIRKLVRSN